MGDSDSSSPLREHLRKCAQPLARRLDVLWNDIAPPLHERQTRADGNIGGRLHVEQVERNIWRFINEAGRLDDFRDAELLFLLSVAACTHDFDKGLESCLPDGLPHGVGSGEFVWKHHGELILDFAEAIAVDKIIATHALTGKRYQDALEALPDPFAMQHGIVDLRRLAVLLKVGDALHTDASRVSDLAVDVDKLESKARSKHLGRGGFTGWHIDGSRVVLQAFPMSPEARVAALKSFELLKENEWKLLRRDLRTYLFPRNLELEIHDDKLIPPHELAPRQTSSTESAQPSTPGMDYYKTEDAPAFAGRDWDREQLESLVHSYPVALLVGPSGVGKSSLLHAGLRPAVESLKGWRCIITRPSSGRLLTPTDLADCTTHEPAPDAPLRDFCAAALPDSGHLLIVFDQFEDIAYYGAQDLEGIADQIAAASDVQRERIRLLFSFRDDATSVLGPLWQRVAGSSHGLPTHHLQRLSRDGARDALLRLLKRTGLELAPAGMLDQVLDELAAATQRESGQPLTLVYPPFLQMVFDRLQELSVTGRIDQQRFAELAGSGSTATDRILAEYLERNVEQIGQGSVDDVMNPKKARAVLAVLSRSGGTKGTATEARIAAEAQVAPERLLLLLGELSRRRLARRLGDGTWEVVHDLLAKRIMQNWISEEERRFKHAREILESRGRMFREHHGLLTTEELRDLWLMRARLPLATLTNQERVVLFASMFGCQLQELGTARRRDFEPWLDAFGPDTRGIPGWFWISDIERPSASRFWSDAAATQIRIAARAVAACLRVCARHEDLPLLREMLRAEDCEVRRAAMEAIGRLGMREELTLLLKGRYSDVRQAAAETIGKQGAREDLPLLRGLLKDEDCGVRRAAVEVIGKLGTREDLPLLRGMLKDNDLDVSEAAGAAFGKLATHEDLPLLRSLMKDEDYGVRRTAVEAIGKLGTREDLPLVRGMIMDRDSEVRLAAGEAIGKVGSSEDVPLLLTLSMDTFHDVHQAAVEAIGRLATREDLLKLRRILKDDASHLRKVAGETICTRATREDLPLLLEMLKGDDYDVFRAAGDALGKVGTREDLPLLRELLKDQDSDVRQAVVEAIGKLGTREDLPLLREMLKDEDHDVRHAAGDAIVNHATREDLPLLRELLKDQDSDVRNATGETIIRLVLTREPNFPMIEFIREAILSGDARISSNAARVASRTVPREQLLAFLDAHQNEMTTSALGVLDWFLHAPAFLREAYEAHRRSREDEEEDRAPWRV